MSEKQSQNSIDRRWRSLKERGIFQKFLIRTDGDYPFHTEFHFRHWEPVLNTYHYLEAQDPSGRTQGSRLKCAEPSPRCILLLTKH